MEKNPAQPPESNASASCSGDTEAQTFPSHDSPDSSVKIDRSRYTTVRNFFLRAFIHVIFWDIFLNRPILRWLRTNPSRRWSQISRNYRDLAIDMGGVLIKLGQFLSVRVDILPPEITDELIDLRDEIPAAPIEEIIPQIEEDFKKPFEELFEWIAPIPLGAASLGQVHLARLASTHEEVVVKLLRPSIDVLVETDLAAIAVALKCLKHYKRVAMRVNLDWLIEEFTTVTRNELDLLSEGNNRERFANDFAADSALYFPKIYWDYSALRTLTLENVSYIKVGDSVRMKEVGISPKEVAKKLYNVYLQQIFTTYFVHADPHPGNIFIRPLPGSDEMAQGITSFTPHDDIPYLRNRQCQIVFVDFGMVTSIPPRLRTALREYAIGVGSRDAHRIVQSYVKAGTLLPGADLKRLEEAHQAILDRFWGADISRMKDMALTEGQTMIREYRDVIYDAPFQFQVDMLFAVRAIAILSGIATHLDNKFDPWLEIIPFAEKLATEELSQNWQHYIVNFLQLSQTLYSLPGRIDSVVKQAEQGNLTIKTSLSPDHRKHLIRLTRAVNRLSWTFMSIGLMLTGILIGGQYDEMSITLIFSIVALLLFIWGSQRGD